MSYRVLTGQIMHETNTFSRLKTDLDAYRSRYLHIGEAVPEAMRRTRTELGAILDAAAKYGWTLAHPIAANAVPSGRVTEEAWQYLRDTLLTAAKNQGPFDGIVLALHGAMVTETTDDAEGELLAALRESVGPDVPIIVILDLHANVTDRMGGHANALIAYRTYPHVDQYERATQAADLLQRSMDGEIKPHAIVARGAMLDGADHGRSQSGPMVELLARAEEFEKEAGVLAVSIQAGFPWTDIEQAGPTVAVTGDNNKPRCREIAESLVQYIWETRNQISIKTVRVADAMAVAAGPDTSGKPLVIADFADNPGGGGYGDTTRLLRGMIEADLRDAAFAVITDPETVKIAAGAGVGSTVELRLGGKIDPTFGAPLEIAAKVVNLTDGRFTCDGPMHKGLKVSMGPTAVLRVGGIEVVVTTHRLQVTDLQTFLSVGIDPRKKSVAAVKSAHHFRAAFEPIARRVIVVDAGGLTSRNFRELEYKTLRRPIFPLDLD